MVTGIESVAGGLYGRGEVTVTCARIVHSLALRRPPQVFEAALALPVRLLSRALRRRPVRLESSGISTVVPISVIKHRRERV